MRDDEAALLAGRGGVREVGYVLAHLAVGKGGEHVLFVHERIARRVDDDDAALHHGDRLGVDHALGGIERRHVDRDEVARAIDGLDVLAVLDGAAEVPGGVNGKVGVVAEDFHAEGHGGVGDLLADRPKADDTQLLAFDLRAGESLLGLLGGLVDGGVGRVLLDPLDAADDVAACQQQRGDDEFLHAVGVRAGRVEHDDALLGIFGVGDVVDAGARARDSQQVRARREFVHLGATHEDRIGLGEVLGTLVGVRKVPEPHLRDGIQACILPVVHSLFSFSLEFIVERRAHARRPILYHIFGDNGHEWNKR